VLDIAFFQATLQKVNTWASNVGMDITFLSKVFTKSK